jgi:ATP-dependent helicase HrpB
VTLPVVDALPALRAALGYPGTAVLQAPPGAGKTTVVPLELLHEPWLKDRKIVMLEPRRLAARAAARRMAGTLGEPVGRTVGYRVRMDTRVSAATRIEVVTEGVLTRMRQDDPALEGIGLVIFDEFHERSLHADLGLALAIESRTALQPDLRILVMSATLDGTAVARLLDGAPCVTSDGRLFPIETRYRPRPADQRFDAAVASLVREAIADEAGDILVFLPGAGEINRVATLIEPSLPSGTRVFRLHGMLPAEEQDAAIAPSPSGWRKVVLATSIAETSLTIDGVRVVVDGGLMRVPRFSPRTGMTRLETVRVTRASSDQRRGRAGRTAPGVCYRLWAAHEDHGLIPYNAPEILAADLAPLALDLAAAGVHDPSELAWLDLPPAAAYAQARELLTLLGALDVRGHLTDHGRRMANLPLHPRLAHMALEAKRLGHQALAADLAALLSERDIARRGPPTGDRSQLPDVDVRLRLDALTTGRTAAGFEVDHGALRRVRSEAAEWRRRLGVRGKDRIEPDAAGLLLALAYPDRIAQRRAGESGRFLLRNGRGATLPPDQPLAREDFLVAAELDDTGSESRILLAAPLARTDIEHLSSHAIATSEEVTWDSESKTVAARRTRRFGAIVLEQSSLPNPDPALIQRALIDGIRADGLVVLPWSDRAGRIRERLAFLHRLDPVWPDVSDAALLNQLESWLGPALAGVRRKGDLDRLDLAEALLAMLPWTQRARIDELAPERITVPSGSAIAIDYGDPGAPVLAVRLQEVFGLKETPRVGGGRVPLTLHLLSPAYRPVQVTRDLASFWASGYFDVRKDLRGRYPRHHWPDDPLTAAPVRGARRRRD